ncbi:MAG: type II secretion system protein [Acidimicrobiia bacterium]|nr:type II secretion system protein [Acidimicrobiia bacterium]
MPTQLNKQDGFTLLELVIVMAVINRCKSTCLI